MKFVVLKIRWVGVLAIILAASRDSQAQSPQTADLRRRGFEPIDQRIEDIDPLRQSLRRVEPGLNHGRGQESLVYRRMGADGQQKFYFMRDGVVAEYDRSEYVRVENKKAKRIEELTLVPANTIFHIGIPADAPTVPVDARPDQRLGAPLSEFRSRDTGLAESPDEGKLYAAYRQTQTRLVVLAIDRVVDGSESAAP